MVSRHQCSAKLLLHLHFCLIEKEILVNSSFTFSNENIIVQNFKFKYDAALMSLTKSYFKNNIVLSVVQYSSFHRFIKQNPDTQVPLFIGHLPFFALFAKELRAKHVPHLK